MTIRLSENFASGPFRDTSRVVAQSETPRESQRRKGVIVRTRIRGVTRAAFGPEHRFAIRPLTWTNKCLKNILYFIVKSMSSKTIMLLLEEFEGIFGLRLMEEPSGNPFERETQIPTEQKEAKENEENEEENKEEESNEKENKEEEENDEENKEEESNEKENKEEEENDEENESKNKNEEEETKIKTKKKKKKKKKIRDEKGKEFPEISSKREESTIELTVSTKLAQRDVITSMLLVRMRRKEEERRKLLNHDFVSTLEWKRESIVIAFERFTSWALTYLPTYRRKKW
ncbi:hypothetical protein V1478_013562 [Vespula squamosa]|uniref:Uncharacterized protein n=1 Tax=Vespula squamosa TaxID=30214 RepID=A0ABD2A5M1_VESSQ